MTERLTIALDAMGGDHAPDMAVEGAAMARLRFPDVHFLLFGDAARVRPLLDDHPKLADACTIRHTDVAVSAEEKPSIALRQGRNSSMQLSINAVREGEAAGVVSAGNTGALMAMSKISLKMLPGIDRPAIAAYFPTRIGESVMLDLGANIECDAKNLWQFGVMGAAFTRSVLGIKKPTVALLNVGSEEAKGLERVKQAAAMFRQSDLPFEFCGFVEGDDLGLGTVDVFVVDGFTGNIVLKTVEGTVRLYSEHFRTAMRSSWTAHFSFFLIHRTLKKMRQRLDPRRYNGATFLGLNGIVVKSHGGTDAFGFANAVGVAVDMAVSRFNDDLIEEVRNFNEAQPADARVAVS